MWLLNVPLGREGDLMYSPGSGHRDAIVVSSLWEIRFPSSLLNWKKPEDRDHGRHFHGHQYLEILSFPGIG